MGVFPTEADRSLFDLLLPHVGLTGTLVLLVLNLAYSTGQVSYLPLCKALVMNNGEMADAFPVYSTLVFTLQNRWVIKFESDVFYHNVSSVISYSTMEYTLMLILGLVSAATGV